MNKNNQDQKESQMLEKIKWLSISILFIFTFIINYYFDEVQLFIRIFITLFLIIFAIISLFSIKRNQQILSYMKTLKKEIQNIIWPSYKESMHTTLIVIIITIFMSFVLWILDSMIFHLIEFIINLRF
ncbi:preprotein translocase subunit SecE [Buchnera aphidicola (Diuraphis noxia)]|uniref:Protein translocase subunit SecE n=1 Tax=Buchnera aphidicola subsp. Diuraphis noxia TaxID=118101 RepID=A0A1B2H7W2_BUCDN|nr:preprotein translocase subunit SecE [Buchnera aphidicola]ANZ22295.1 preprotein translocase subunit SecE [Buchnera aphidicola (Diuraphis noxia)]